MHIIYKNVQITVIYCLNICVEQEIFIPLQQKLLVINFKNRKLCLKSHQKYRKLS